MLSLPIYLRGNTYYLHTRNYGIQFKRSLRTNDKMLAIQRAYHILNNITSCMDLSKIRKYEIDLQKGVLRSDGEEDHRRMMEALALLSKSQQQPPQQPIQSTESGTQSVSKGLRMVDLLDKFFLLKRHLKQATVLSYKNVIYEFSDFLKNPLVQNVGRSDITRYQEYLAEKGNVVRTIDNKTDTIRAIMNFAIKQGYYFNSNPAGERSIMTKKQKIASGYAIFEEQEIELIYSSDFLKKSKDGDPDYYWTLVLGLVTGCRISEITSLTREQFKESKTGTPYIKILDSKTSAGIREIPIPKYLFSAGLLDFIDGKDQIFKYKLRLGKGSGNAVGKKFSRHLEELKITRDKLVFHSIRKFTNDYFLKNNVEFEVRCQFFGHETNSVNVDIYTNKIDIDKLNQASSSAQMKLLTLSGLLPTRF